MIQSCIGLRFDQQANAVGEIQTNMAGFRCTWAPPRESTIRPECDVVQLSWH